MADDQITQMVNDPDFGKLSPTEQRKALAAHDPIFSKVSDGEIAKFVSAHKPLAIPDAAQQAHEQPKQAALALMDAGGYPELVKAKPSEAMPGRFGMHDQPNPESTLNAMPAFGGGIGALAGPEGALLGAGSGEALQQLIRRAAGDLPVTETPAADIEKAAVMQGLLPEVGGRATSFAAGKAINAASPALARVLRLTPKSVQFGREPAQEVLERGLANGTLPEIKTSIEAASKQVTSDLNAALKGTKGTVNAENLSLDVANQMGGTAGNRFLKIVDDAADKLGLRTNQLSNLSAADANALKQEVARQAKFVEGDMRPSIANGGKIFGGKLKDELIKLNPEVRPLLESSANLTEASKGADYAVRAEKVGQGKGLLGGVQLNKPGTYVRAVTDRPSAPQLLYKIANNLKDHTPISNALRAAFSLVYGNQGEEIQP